MIKRRPGRELSLWQRRKWETFDDFGSCACEILRVRGIKSSQFTVVFYASLYREDSYSSLILLNLTEKIQSLWSKIVVASQVESASVRHDLRRNTDRLFMRQNRWLLRVPASLGHTFFVALETIFNIHIKEIIHHQRSIALCLKFTVEVSDGRMWENVRKRKNMWEKCCLYCNVQNNKKCRGSLMN